MCPFSHMLSPARVAVQQVLQREQPSEGLVQGRGNQAKRRVVKILSDRHVRCRPKSACRVIQTNQLFGSTAQNVLLAGQLWYRRRSEVRGRSERRPFVHPWFVTTTMDVGALQTTSVMASASGGWLEVGGGWSGPSDSVCPCQILIAPISSDNPPPILADW